MPLFRNNNINVKRYSGQYPMYVLVWYHDNYPEDIRYYRIHCLANSLTNQRWQFYNDIEGNDYIAIELFDSEEDVQQFIDDAYYVQCKAVDVRELFPNINMNIRKIPRAYYSSTKDSPPTYWINNNFFENAIERDVKPYTDSMTIRYIREYPKYFSDIKLNESLLSKSKAYKFRDGEEIK